MEQLTLSAPGKTFLLGEYLALVGGASLIVCTQPKFHLTATTANQTSITGITAGCPARQLLKDQHSLWRQLKLTFKDPYAGAGGMGASSAQFLLSYALQEYLTKNTCLSPAKSSINKLLQHYQHYANMGQPFRPSGHDLVAQLSGEICYFHPKEDKHSLHQWPFRQVGFYLLRTGGKIATHQHLATLQTFSYDDLHACMQQAIGYFADHDALNFAACVNKYAHILRQNNLVAEKTQSLLDILRQHPGVLAAKGCGALSADIILVLVYKDKRADFTHYVNQQKLDIIADESHITTGLTINTDTTSNEMAS